MITPPSNNERRAFFKKALAVCCGGAAVLAPVGAGMAVFLDPLRRKAESSKAIRVTTLDSLPEDGVPRKFPVLASRTDAWNKFNQVPIGAVYLRRTADGKIDAFNVACPHAGCYVDFVPEQEHFLCPCHNSTFAVNGRINDPHSPSPRGLDTLVVEIRNKKEVWVKFQNFLPGQADKVPVA